MVANGISANFCKHLHGAREADSDRTHVGKGQGHSASRPISTHTDRLSGRHYPPTAPAIGTPARKDGKRKQCGSSGSINSSEN
ncbi:hypothetical protein GCM10010195_25130 [Kitasatospora griseola]|nr:hypothetical protein GCM10010195_25130 [Kitasatospora griseola]